jgi:ribosomal protein S18 acetylase RimI-like enzyme
MPLMALVVRPIQLAETRALRQSVLRPHETLDELASTERPDTFGVGAFDADALAAVGLIQPEGGPGSWRIRGMATLPSARGRGAGTAVLAALVAHAEANGATRIWCNARVRAISLYERAGFQVTSDVFEPPNIGPHVVMEKDLRAES